jgi:phosphatidylglycerophosphate synthase
MHGPNQTGIDIFLVGACEAAAFSLPQRERFHRSLAGHRVWLHDSIHEACRGDQALIIRTDWVIEKRILQALVTRRDVLVKQNGEGKPTYIAALVPKEKLEGALELIGGQPDELPGSLKSSLIVGAGEICGAFQRELRKSSAPVVAQLTRETRHEVERALFRSSYKGATDFITKYLWPVPAFHAVRALAKRGISPNAVTLLSLLCVIATTWLFFNGWFWSGLATAYLMAFLDTVDGKLARVTLTSSPWGHLLDHGVDLVSPPIWWGAWFAGLINTGLADSAAMQALGWEAFWIIMVLYWAVRGVETLFVRVFGFNIHIWKPQDFAFRLITTRRNVNIAILTLGLSMGRPDLGFMAVAFWAIVSLAYHTIRLCQAWLARRRGGPVHSWLS